MATKKAAKPKEKTGYEDYRLKLVLSRDREGMKKYNNYLRSHAAELRRLERLAAGDLVPEGFDDESEDE